MENIKKLYLLLIQYLFTNLKRFNETILQIVSFNFGIEIEI